MNTQTFARIFGAAYLIVGILGFVPFLVSTPAPDPDVAVHAAHGRLFGLFPVNAIHNLVHIGVGIWGLVAASSMTAAIGFARAMAVTFGLLTVLGLIPATNTLFGLTPLYGHDVWLHALTAAVNAYFGFATPQAAATTTRRVA